MKWYKSALKYIGTLGIGIIFGYNCCVINGSSLGAPPIKNNTPSFSKMSGATGYILPDKTDELLYLTVFDSAQASRERYSIEYSSLTRSGAPDTSQMKQTPVIQATPTVQIQVELPQSDYIPSGSGKLTKTGGVFNGPSGKETYYNLPMGVVVEMMRAQGFDEVNYPYWVRDDGCKMLGDYIMIAANLNLRPKGTIVETSLGPGLVCDTGGFAKSNQEAIDIAVNW